MNTAEIQERIGAVARLAQLKQAGDFDQATQKLYFEALKDIPVEALHAACVRCAAALTYGMPDAAVIRATAEVVLREAWSESQVDTKRLAPKPGDEHHPFEHCTICHDAEGAWVSQWCPGTNSLARTKYTGEFETTVLKLKIEHCTEPKDHACHSFAVRCACFNAPWRMAMRPPAPISPTVPGGKKRHEW